MQKSPPDAKHVYYDFFGKFVRAWAAGFASQIILPSVVGYFLVFTAFSPALKRVGLDMALAADLLFIPSAVFTAGIATLCVMLANRLRTAVVATAIISLAIPAIVFAPAMISIIQSSP